MKNLKYAVGIDVSMKELACCLSVINDEQEVKIRATHKFANTGSGFSSLQAWLRKHRKEPLPVLFVMEATGVYHEALAWSLYSHSEQVVILLPSKAKDYLKANGSKSKNDKINARGLAQMGAERKLAPWVPPSEQLYVLKTYTRHHQSTTEMLTAMNNQLHSLEHGQFQIKAVIKQLKQTIKLFEKQLKELEERIGQVIKTDDILRQHYQHISAIKGIGLLSFAVIAAETNGFTLFRNAASLVSYAGYDVVENQSGKHTGRTRISKKGNSRIRRILHMPALCAVRDDQPQFKNLFERVYERTRIKMKGYVAVQKKLLVIIYHLWKKNESYDPAYNIIAPYNDGAKRDGSQINETLI